MLQVGVGDARLAEPRRQLHPQVQEHLEVLRPLEVLLDELVEHQPFDPAHLQHREPLAIDADALLQVLEIDGEGELRLFQVGGDVAVALLLPRHLAGEALQGPGVAGGRAMDLVDVGKIARPEHGQAQRRTHDLAAAQFLVVQESAGPLYRFGYNRSV